MAFAHINPKHASHLAACALALCSAAPAAMAQIHSGIYCGENVVGQPLNSTLQAMYMDSYNNTIQIENARLFVDPLGQNVQLAFGTALTISFAYGNTTCQAGGSLPCKIGPGGMVQNGLPGDPSDGAVIFAVAPAAYTVPAAGHVNISGVITFRNLCDVSPSNCYPNPLNHTCLGAYDALPDCNTNGAADIHDIDSGVSDDSNLNDIPDECEAAFCPADAYPLGGGDGMIGIDDLLLIIINWGATGANPADIAPPETGGNGVVNIDDLLAVVSTWGPCP